MNYALERKAIITQFYFVIKHCLDVMNALSFLSCQRCSCHKAVLFVGKGFLEIKTKQQKVIKCSVITRKHHIRARVLRPQMQCSLKPKELEQRDT